MEICHKDISRRIVDEGGNWIELAQDRVKRRAVVLILLSLWVLEGLTLGLAVFRSLLYP
jgi:hypothetical protein